MKLKVKVLEITKKEISDILSIGMTYSGVEYWAEEITFNQNLYNELREKIVCYEDILAEMLVEIPQRAKFFIKPEDEEPIELTVTKIKKGIELAIQEGYLTREIEDYDAQDADIIIQYALFEELIYG